MGTILNSSKTMKAPFHAEGYLRQPAKSECAAPALATAENNRLWMPWNDLLSQLHQKALLQRSAMTVAEFVERKFVPEHVALKGTSGRTHYQAMLKHVLTPEEVDRVFGVQAVKPGVRMKALPDWPYLSNVRLCDLQPDHIRRLIAAALARGYSTQTVAHLRNVASAIVSHAKREGCFTGDNPVTLVEPLDVVHKPTCVLNMGQVKKAFAALKYPAKEMMLMVVFTSMNVSEICGLQWKYINLTDQTSNIEGEQIPPKTIAVRKQWFRGELGSVKTSRVRNLPIPSLLLSNLREIRDNSRFNREDSFVFVSRHGTPANETNIRMHVFPEVAQKLGISSLSWHVFLRTHKALESELGLGVGIW